MAVADAGQTVGLIAGWGRFPIDLARAARGQGQRVAAVGLHGLTDPELEQEVDSLAWLFLGQVGEILRTLHRAGASQVVLAGKVPKDRLLADPGALRLDERALTLLARLEDQRDDAILAGIADMLAEEGIQVLPQAEFVPELLAREGRLGAVDPTPAQLADVAFAWPIAKQIGALDIGQTLVVRDRAVLAVEAIEGTDAAIRRGGSLAGGGACVVKVMRPSQDPRSDLPAVGPRTIDALVETKAALLAVEARRTLLLEREELIRQADANGIGLLGVPSEGPRPEGSS